MAKLSPQEYWKQLNSHDWTYVMSDDIDTYTAGKEMAEYFHAMKEGDETLESLHEGFTHYWIDMMSGKDAQKPLYPISDIQHEILVTLKEGWDYLPISTLLLTDGLRQRAATKLADQGIIMNVSPHTYRWHEESEVYLRSRAVPNNP